jgi:hypothetical protein
VIRRTFYTGIDQFSAWIDVQTAIRRFVCDLHDAAVPASTGQEGR